MTSYMYYGSKHAKIGQKKIHWHHNPLIFNINIGK